MDRRVRELGFDSMGDLIDAQIYCGHEVYLDVSKEADRQLANRLTRAGVRWRKAPR